jgi:hypothetical protein
MYSSVLMGGIAYFLLIRQGPHRKQKQLGAGAQPAGDLKSLLTKIREELYTNSEVFS